MNLKFESVEDPKTEEAYLRTTNPMATEFADKVVLLLKDQCEAIQCPLIGTSCVPNMFVAKKGVNTACIVVRNELNKFYIAKDDRIRLREADPDRVTAFFAGGDYRKVGRVCPLPTIPEIAV